MPGEGSLERVMFSMFLKIDFVDFYSLGRFCGAKIGFLWVIVGIWNVIIAIVKSNY